MDGLTLSEPEEDFSERVLIKYILGRPDKGGGLAGRKVQIGGWVKTGRKAEKGTLAFLQVSDASSPETLQVLVKSQVYNPSRVVATGTCVHVEGVLHTPPETATQQKIELHATSVIFVGPVDDAANYPLPKSKTKAMPSLESLRVVPHLRPRAELISAIARIRHALAYATHTFFDNHDFLHIHTPIITTSDCEGAGEMFQVTTLINKAEKLEKELKEHPPPSEADFSKEEIVAGLDERFKLGERLRLSGGNGIPKKDGKIDYTEDYFARPAFLTVSGQLHAEAYACSLGSVYTFGPTFRAENSHTTRHLAEFWMVEAEIAFAGIQVAMKCAEAYVRFLCQWLLDRCYADMEFMTKHVDETALQRLEMVAKSEFYRITYTEAVAILEEASEKKKFENKVEWGIDLASEHERYLAEEKFRAPVIVYNYPKEKKAFYMKVNEDNKTVAAMDVLVPNVGELIGGGQREEDYETLHKRMSELEIPVEAYEWYLDLRRYGTCKHSGFGLGFERMILFATGVDNIRDVIPFPRCPGRADT